MSTVPLDDDALNQTLSEARELRDEFQRFLHEYEFGMREIETKISILRDEFTHHHSYNPIEHVKSRVKSPDSIVEKIARRGIEPDFAPSVSTSPTSRVCGSPAASWPTSTGCSICSPRRTTSPCAS